MRVLFISYNGLTEPLGRRQVLPYILGLGRRGWEFRVLSFEKESTLRDQEVVLEALRGVGAQWIPLRYHRRPPVLSTLFDMARCVAPGVLGGYRPALLHARSTVPATVASRLSRRFRAPWVFDVRGLLGREYADAGHWRPNGLLHRLTESTERRLLGKASGLVFLTQTIARDLARAHVVPPAVPIEVVPCTVDLGTFRPDSDARRAVRNALGFGASPVLVYSGSLGSWYRVDEMVAFFLAARREIEDLRFLVLTPQVEVARAAIERVGATQSVVLSLKPDQVPRHLAAADAGICFLGDLPSKKASSPTKYGEYLASGLPVITTRWTGDAAALEGELPWVLVDSFSDASYREAAQRLAQLLASGEDTVRASRALAERDFSLETAVQRYDRLYRRVLGCGP